MTHEIERKFLPSSSDWRKRTRSNRKIIQGYLNLDKERTVRVRVLEKRGLLTIKGPTKGITRLEFEYDIPRKDAKELIALCEKPIIEKTRYEVEEAGNIWEVDEFEGDNKGLVLAEIELKNEHQAFNIPKWIGKEVSHDRRYYNSSLIKQPFKDW